MDLLDLLHRQKGPLGLAENALSGASSSGRQVTGTRRGQVLTFAAPGETTEIRAPVPELPFQLELRPEAPGDKLLVERGLAVDLRVGDADFDRAFVVEGAPADVVRRLLDADLRGRLLALYPVSLRVAAGELTLTRTPCLEHGLEIEDALDLVALAAGRLRGAFAEADADALARTPPVGAPFRGGPDARALAAAQDARRGELNALARVRSRRALLHDRPVVLYGLVAAVVVASFIALVASWIP